MGFKDLIVTPFYLLVFSLLAYLVRPYLTTPATRRYFLPALWTKFLGAIALGLVYQFYYGGGDTFNYWEHGSRHIYNAFWQDPLLGLKLLLEKGGTRQLDTYFYSQHIWYYRDIHSFFIVRITAFFDLFTFHTYSATALFFSVFSFSGLWALFSVVQQKYPDRTKWIALSILFVPTVVFWGSGILKDTITLGALGWLTYAAFQVIENNKRNPLYLLIAFSAGWLILSVKMYILIIFLPTMLFWVFMINISNVRNQFIKAIIAPILLLVFAIIAFFTANSISATNEKYNLENLAERAAITAYDIRYGWGARTGGDGGYDLGVLDGTWQSMVRLFPAAVNVSLFRPYLWEVRNPLMLLSALESLTLLALTFYLFIYKKQYSVIYRDPFLGFCLLFSVLFAFGVGVSTFNFGTLMRYKIPMVPFYLLSISINPLFKR